MNERQLTSIAAIVLVVGCGSVPTLVSESPGLYHGVYYERTWLTETNMEIRPYQTREFEASKRKTFDATRSAIENAGYVIKEVDYEAGLLKGKTPPLQSRQVLRGTADKSAIAVVSIEVIEERLSLVRIDFVSSIEYIDLDRDLNIIREGIRKPGVFQEVFDDIQELLSPK